MYGVEVHHSFFLRFYNLGASEHLSPPKTDFAGKTKTALPEMKNPVAYEGVHNEKSPLQTKKT